MEREHPEMLLGEMYLTNTCDDEYHKISYKTKRMGRIVYAPSGYIIQGLFPVFVDKGEYDGHMMDLHKMKMDDMISSSRRKLHDDIVKSRPR